MYQQGIIKTNGSMIGILSNNEFIKLSLKELASQVIDEDTVEFDQGIVKNILQRKRQPFIGIVTKITPKLIYIHLPLLNPFSSIAYPYLPTKIGTKVVGWIGLNEFTILDCYNDNKNLIHRYYTEWLKMDSMNLQGFNAIDKPIKDLTHLQTFHIDPPGCKDIDDFMSCDKKNNKIYIHIVDITKYISWNSQEDQLQRKIGYTWYFPNFHFDLFPNVKKIFENKEIYCLTLEIHDDQIEFYPSKIHCQYDFTYSQVQDLFDGKSTHPLQEDLLWSLEKVNLPKPSPYRRLYWNEKETISFEEECLAHRYVSGWMIFYNSWFAEKFQSPQRFHPETKLFQIPYQDELPKEIQYVIYVKQMRQAEYKNQAGHFGLEKKFYTHATSPLRRYFDRLNQYIYFGEIQYCPDEMLEHLNRMERISERIQEWYHKQLMFQYIELEKEKLWNCYVVNVFPKGIEVYIYDLQEFLFLSNLQLKIGNQIQLKLYIDRKGIPTLKYVG